MSKLDKLSDLDQAPQVSFGVMPDEGMGLVDPPYPGAYKVRLPAELNWEPMKSNLRRGDAAPVEVARIRASFDAGHPLTIVETTPENKEYIGTTISFYSISNAEFEYGKDNALTSEMAWLLKNGFNVELPDSATNLQYGQALEQQVGKTFGCDLEWSSYCNPEKPRYIYDDATGQSKQDTKAGCGVRYQLEAWKDTQAIPRNPVYNEEYLASYLKQLVEAKVPEDQAQAQIEDLRSKSGKFAAEFKCSKCGALLRCFPRLRRYRAA
ncbi:MAG: hypothetical protein ACYTDW_01405 [Planctomycetota bacterium]|jgi:hypothetical protein